MRPRIKLQLTDFQCLIHQAVNYYRTVIFCGGRGVGKTVTALFEIICGVFKAPKQKVLYACHSCALADEVYMMLVNDPAVKPYIKRAANRPHAFIEFKNGSLVRFWSMEKSDNKRGFRAHLLLLDECGLIKQRAWETILRPVLSAWRGKAILMSSATGKNHWFYKEYRKGLKKADGIISFKVTSYRGLSYQGAEGRAELAREKRGMSREAFRQEYLCKWVDTKGGKPVFKESIIENCLTGDLKPSSKERTLLLYDIGGGGEKQDPSGIVILDGSANVLHAEALKVDDAVKQLEYVATLEEKYNAQVVVESNGTNRDNLIALYRPYFKRCPRDIGVNASTKPLMVERLRLALEKRILKIPREAKELIRQLKLWQVVDRGSRFSFTHPDGDHDDICSALLIGVTALFEERMIPPLIDFHTNKKKTQGKLW